MTTTNGTSSTPLISGLAHVNITIPSGSLDLAKSFYSETLGLTPRAVPAAQADSLAWFDISDSGQQLHVSYAKHDKDLIGHTSSRHPCFKIANPDAMLKLQRQIYDHFEKGGEAAPLAADKPGVANSGSKGPEYPQRFFARDFAGNRLEFSL